MTCPTCGARPPLWLRLAVRLAARIWDRYDGWYAPHYDRHDPMTEPWGDL